MAAVRTAAVAVSAGHRGHDIAAELEAAAAEALAGCRHNYPEVERLLLEDY